MMILIGVIACHNPLPGQALGVKFLSFKIDDWVAEFYGESSERKREVKDISFGGRSESLDLREDLSLRTSGSLYHPSLLSYQMDVTLGLNQGRIKINSEDNIGSENLGILRNMRFTSNLLSNKMINISTGIFRNTSRKEVSFIEKITTNSERESIRLNLGFPKLPTTLDISQERKNEVLGLREVYEEQQKINLNSKFGEMSKLNGSFKATKTQRFREEKARFSQHHDNLNMQANVGYPLGSSILNKMNHMIFYSEMFGIDSTRSFNFRSNMTYSLAHNLIAQSNLGYIARDFNGLESDSKQYQMGLQHALYSSLRSDASISGVVYSDDIMEKSSMNAKANIQYTKSIGKHGRLNLRVGYEPATEKTTIKESVIQSTQVEISLNSYTNTFIYASNVDPNSVEVFGLIDNLVYDGNLDYHLLVTSSFIQIQRALGSQIPDSSAVLVTYDYSGPGSYDLLFSTKSYDISYSYQDFWGLEVGYSTYNMSYQKEDQGGELNLDPRVYHQLLMNLEYSPIRMQVIYELTNSEINPYNLATFSLDCLAGSYANQYLLGSLQITRQNLIKQADRVDQYGLHTEYFRRLSKNTRFIVGYGIRGVSSSLNQLLEDNWNVTFQYTHRRIRVDISLLQTSQKLFDAIDQNRKGMVRVFLNS